MEKKSDETIQNLKAKVRALALHTTPSEPLILLTLDELARLSRRQNHEEAETFEELARQAKFYQGKVNMADLCLTALGGKAADTVTKALTKCLKQKQEEKPALSNTTSTPDAPTMIPPMISPLANVYPPFPNYNYQGYPGSQPFGFPWYAQQGQFGQRRRGVGNISMARPWRPRGACLFCESMDHQVRDCEKMKLAKGK